MNKISEKLMFQEANKRGVKMSKLGHFPKNQSGKSFLRFHSYFGLCIQITQILITSP